MSVYFWYYWYKLVDFKKDIDKKIAIKVDKIKYQWCFGKSINCQRR